MTVTDYITKEIKPLTLNNTVAEAKELCKNFPISHILIVEQDNLIGCFIEEDIRSIDNTSSKLKEYNYLLNHFYTDEKASLLELISLFADNDCNLIPVLGENQKYIGYYYLSDVLDVFADSPFLHRDNETLIVEKLKKDFSMSQIAQIVESNKATLVGSYVSNETTDNIQITLKIASKDINEIIQTFRRYDYHVLTQHIDDEYLEKLRERANYFRRYLEV